MDLPLIFIVLVAFAVAIYVMADGFDLGVGILLLAAPHEIDRDIMVQSIEPVWDGNETWLVLGGTLLFTAFPPAYFILLPAFYLPIMLMLFSLVFRGVAFSFRFQTTRFRPLWDFAFAAASVLAAFSQGLILGGMLGGVEVQNGIFAGGPFDFLSLLGALCGIGLISGYALLGSGWLIWKTEGTVQVFAREIGHSALLLTAAMMLVVSAWTAFSDPAVSVRWFSWPNVGLLAPIPILTAAMLFATWRSFSSHREGRVFLLSIGVFLLGFVGLAVSLWPYVVPRHFTIWTAASDETTLIFAGTGLAFVLPIVLAYQCYAYWVFRGKVSHLTIETKRATAPPKRRDLS